MDALEEVTEKCSGLNLEDDSSPTFMDLLRSLTEKLSSSTSEFAELVERSNREAQAEVGAVAWRSETLLIEKIFLRFHADDERIGLNPDSPNHKVHCQINPFAEFIQKLADACEDDEEVQNLTRSKLLTVKPIILLKIVKTALLLGDGIECAAIKIFSSDADHFERSSIWDKCIVNTIPLRSYTACNKFWANWFKCVLQRSKVTEAWRVVNDNWIHHSSNSDTAISATLALLSICREAKIRGCFREWGLLEFNLHTKVTDCMGSTNLTVRDCGMFVAFVLADIHYWSVFTANGNGPKAPDIIEFGSNREHFLQLKNFYTELEPRLEQNSKELEVVSTSPKANQDPVPQGRTIPYSVKEDMKSCISFDQIYQCLIENDKVDEQDQLAYVLRICTQLQSGVVMDGDVAANLTRLVAEFDDNELLTASSILACAEMLKVHTDEVCTTFASIIFDSRHYNLGQRLHFLRLYADVMELRAGTKCLTCFPFETENHANKLNEVDPEFQEKYLRESDARNQCFRCIKKFGRQVQVETNEPSSSLSQQKSIVENLPCAIEIRERRIEAKTRRFTSKKRAASVKFGSFSRTVAPSIWASILNNLLKSQSSQSKLSKTLMDLDIQLVISCLQVLERLIYCTEQSAFAYYNHFALGAKSLVDVLGAHSCIEVRRHVFRICGTLVNRASDGRRLVESVGQEFFNALSRLTYSEGDDENKTLLLTIRGAVEYYTVKLDSDPL